MLAAWGMRGRRAGAIVLTIGFGVSLLVQTTDAWAVTSTGKIAFTSDRDGNQEIYVMDADGSNQTDLTNKSANDLKPSFSSDGARIVFVSERDGNDEIYVMDADGSNQTRLTNDPGLDDRPSFSPDGSSIVFTSDRNGFTQIFVMNANGSSPTAITNSTAGDFTPRYSPDGSKIVFVSLRDNTDYEIYIMDSDGSNPVRLTNNTVSDRVPTFSPDGATIAFTSTRDNAQDEIYVMNADGSGATRLTNNTFSDNRPWFSPDGSSIAFESNRDGNSEIYAMDADGGNQTRLTNNTANDGSVSWGPTAGPPPQARPDAQVAGLPRGPWTGNDIYDASGATQAVAKSVARGSAANFYVRCQNDAAVADAFRGATTSGVPGYVVTYFVGGTNVTAFILAGTATTGSLAPGASRRLRVQVRVRGFTPPGSSASWTISCTSVSSPSVSDAVQVHVNVT